MTHPRPTSSHETPQPSLERRLEFLALDDDDLPRLQQCVAAFQLCAEQFVETFYAHLESFDETSQLLKDEELVARLKIAQRDHFMSMLQADWSAEYAERRRQVGRTHAERGLEPTWFLGSYNLFVQQSIDHLVAEIDVPDDGRFDQLRSLMKVIFLDVGLSLDEYFAALTKDLRRALDMFYDANTELRQFAHFTSHDLKTPLGTVANLCEEVLDEFGDQIPAEARKLIQSAQDTTYRMSSTIDELLATTIDREKGSGRRTVSLQGPIQDAAGRVARELNVKQIELRLPESYPEVVGNQVQLREVFYNLFSNAMKYIDKQPGLIDVEIVEASDGLSVTIAVKDNGPGIPPEEQARIFAPFRRLAKHRDVSGSGLGLYFTNYVVEQQGGRLWLESELGESSTFFVQLRGAS